MIIGPVRKGGYYWAEGRAKEETGQIEKDACEFLNDGIKANKGNTLVTMVNRGNRF